MGGRARREDIVGSASIGGISPQASASVLLALLLVVSVQGCGIPQSAARGDAAAVRKYLAEGDDPDKTDWKRRSGLELSIILGKTEVLDVLIEGGADLNRRGKGTRTPLMWASMRFGTPEVINKLVDAGADPNLGDKGGQTPLLFSVLYGTPAQTKALIERGADVRKFMKPKWKSPVLNVAIRRGKAQAVTLLVSAGAALDARDGRGDTARQLAATIPNMPDAISRGLEMRADQVGGRVAASPERPRRESATPTPQPRTQEATPHATQLARLPRSDIPSGLRMGRYYARVIGNNAYTNLPTLQTAVNDANALSELLRTRYGFEVTTLLDASRAETLQALARYRRLLREDDNFLIYYAGHGWLDEDADRGYWLPVDATQDDDVFWIANESITSKTRAMSAKHVIVIADSCYSGKLSRGIHVNQDKPGYLERLAERRARVVLTSGGVEPVSDSGGRDNHSVFASALLRALAENTGVLEGHELFTRIRRPVVLNSNQIPEYSDMRRAGHDGGDFLFIVQ